MLPFKSAAEKGMAFRAKSIRLIRAWRVMTWMRGLETLGMVSTLRCCKVISLIIIGVCVFVIGCGPDTIWSAEALSPDGARLASARTVATSGFGTGYIWTAVYLKWAKGSQAPIEILGLTDEFETPYDEKSVQMKWLTPTHLEVTYKSKGHRTLDFQAIKWADVDISVRDLSNKTDTSQK
jgi:hypothetical protein